MSNLNSNWINLTFIIDESGSMYGSQTDVVGGFNKIIDEQKANKDGKVTVSLYKFASNVTKVYLGKDIYEIDTFEYSPHGNTAMNDGIGKAIDEVGASLYEQDKNGEELPGANLVVVMTDGMENASVEYTLKQIQDKIKEQTEKYSWQFIYEGVDITSSKTADTLGFKFKTYSSRGKLGNNYDIINSATSMYRALASKGITLAASTLAFCNKLQEDSTKNTVDYETEIGKKISTD